MKRLLVFLLLFISSYIIDISFFAPNKNQNIKVEIKGEVLNEGVYELENYRTINDLLELAILKETADTSSINLNTTLHNGDVIYIPKKDENNVKISINTSDSKTLEIIPGIGPSTAERIINYRNENGLFQNIEDIKNVKGIGEKKYEKIKEFIKL